MRLLKLGKDYVNPLQISRIVSGAHGAYDDELTVIMSDGAVKHVTMTESELVSLVNQAMQPVSMYELGQLLKEVLAPMQPATIVGKGLDK